LPDWLQQGTIRMRVENRPRRREANSRALFFMMSPPGMRLKRNAWRKEQEAYLCRHAQKPSSFQGVAK
jgi:hypothetical protein